MGTRCLAALHSWPKQATPSNNHAITCWLHPIVLVPLMGRVLQDFNMVALLETFSYKIQIARCEKYRIIFLQFNPTIPTFPLDIPVGIQWPEFNLMQIVSGQRDALFLMTPRSAIRMHCTAACIDNKLAVVETSDVDTEDKASFLLKTSDLPLAVWWQNPFEWHLVLKKTWSI